MTKCIQCHKKYIAYDDDAGTWREHFCSEDCRDKYDKELNTLIQSPQQGVKAELPILVGSVPCPKCGGCDFYCADCKQSA